MWPWGYFEPFGCKSHSKSQKISFSHFSRKIVISKYKRHGYQMKERKILYKKVPSDYGPILSHSTANRTQIVKKSVFHIFLEKSSYQSIRDMVILLMSMSLILFFMRSPALLKSFAIKVQYKNKKITSWEKTFKFHF